MEKHALGKTPGWKKILSENTLSENKLLKNTIKKIGKYHFGKYTFGIKKHFQEIDFWKTHTHTHPHTPFATLIDIKDDCFTEMFSDIMEI